MKTQLLKKLFFAATFSLVTGATLQAQTIFSSNFTDGEGYTDGLAVNSLTEWTGDSNFVANANDQITNGANWKRLLLLSPISGTSDGKFITASFSYEVGGANFVSPTNTLAISFFGFKSNNNTTDYHDREGIVLDIDSGDNTVLTLKSQSDNDGANGNGSNGSSNIGTPISTTATAAFGSAYQLVIELAIGADNTSSTMSLSVDGAAPVTVTGIDPELYAAATSGSGIYFWTWTYAASQRGITEQRLNSLTVAVSDDSLLSSKNINAFDFAIYPNPVNEELSISTDETIESVQVLDLVGKTVISTSVVNGSVNVSSLKSGIYVVKVNSSKGSATSKFVKK